MKRAQSVSAQQKISKTNHRKQKTFINETKFAIDLIEIEKRFDRRPVNFRNSDTALRGSQNGFSLSLWVSSCPHQKKKLPRSLPRRSPCANLPTHAQIPHMNFFFPRTHNPISTAVSSGSHRNRNPSLLRAQQQSHHSK